MKLVKEKCTKQGYEKYNDYYLIYQVGDKERKVRVRPCFSCDNKVFELLAENN